MTHYPNYDDMGRLLLNFLGVADKVQVMRFLKVISRKKKLVLCVTFSWHVGERVKLECVDLARRAPFPHIAIARWSKGKVVECFRRLPAVCKQTTTHDEKERGLLLRDSACALIHRSANTQ